DHAGKRDQADSEHGDRGVGDQAVAALGHHHGIEHDVLGAVADQAVGDDRGDLGGAEHPDLDRIDADVAEHGVDLLADEFGVDRTPGDNALGVLGGEGGDDRGGVGAERRDGL